MCVRRHRSCILWWFLLQKVLRKSLLLYIPVLSTLNRSHAQCRPIASSSTSYPTHLLSTVIMYIFQNVALPPINPINTINTLSRLIPSTPIPSRTCHPRKRRAKTHRERTFSIFQ
ncbi:hypothetical protein BDD12DRAFT_817002 [Trichophaea hybrida]|nr:hypothetical protein BDD12DRAFT_817002 [Trichophaea hybrida]